MLAHLGAGLLLAAVLGGPGLAAGTDRPDNAPAPAAAAESPPEQAPGEAAARGAAGSDEGTASSTRKEDDEVRLGRRVAAMLEAEYKLVRDPEALARLERIGRDIAAVSEEPGYPYTFKILDTEETNALSLPGGFTYFTKGMLSFVRSDDELAGVLAHEIAHAAHHHVRENIRREAEMNRHVLIGILGALLLGRGQLDTVGNLLLGAEAVKTAYMSDYTQAAESDADRTAVEYLTKSGKYNPVGVLTVMERLARDEERRTGPPAGIAQDHPSGVNRVRALEGYLRARGIAIDRLAVQDQIHARARQSEGESAKGVEVVVNDMVVCRSATMATAEAAAGRINAAMRRGLHFRDVGVAPDGITVVAAGESLFAIGSEDAALEGRPAAEVARQSARELGRALWQVQMEQVF